MTTQRSFDAILSTCVTLEDGKSLSSFFELYRKSYSVAIIQIFSVGKMILGCSKTRIHSIQGSTTAKRRGVATKRRGTTRKKRKHITKLIRKSTKIKGS